MEHAVDEPDLTDAKVYEVSDKPTLGGGRWYVLPDDTTLFQPFGGDVRAALVTASTLRSMPTWREVAS